MKALNRFRQKYLPNTLVRVARKPLDYYVSLLASGTPFSFSRFGDGEWNAMLGRPGENCDGHAFFPELGRDLRDALVARPAYLCGMQYRAIRDMGTDIKRFLDSHKVTVAWQDADVFHYANNDGTLFPLVKQLRAMKVAVVGPPHLSAMSDSVFPYDHFIEIPLKNCYLNRDDIERRIGSYYESSGPAVIAFSASMTTNVLIHRLYPLMGKTSWLIDFGSLWDVYVGVKSRGGYASEDWTLRIKKNLGLA
ncbi:MAG TPA: hypothetical protein VLX68_11635 [Chitinivibrionales bacterium]|nr:hypothetical protein [Chitinivibrionales bacterium]